MPENTQEARLKSTDNEVVATLQVEAFPRNPSLIIWHGRYFVTPDLGYGPFIAYHEVTKVLEVE